MHSTFRMCFAITTVFTSGWLFSCAPEATQHPSFPPPTADAAAGGASGESPSAGVLKNPAEIARRLSRYLWSVNSPDSSILAALEAEPTVAQVGRLAEMMLDDPRAREGIEAFFTWWLRLSDLVTLEKPSGTLNAALRGSMAREAGELGTHIVLGAGGSFESLFLAPYTFADDILARHYGVAEAAPRGEFKRIDYPDGQRLGILGGAGVLTRFSGPRAPVWPARRFWLIEETLLCEALPLTPAVNLEDINTASPINPSQGLRQQMLETSNNHSCPPCHAYVDQVGFAFMAFDTLGRFAPRDAAGPIDTRGELPAFGDDPNPIKFSGQPELVRALVRRPDVQRCFARRVLTFSLDPIVRDVVNTTPPGTDYDTFEASVTQLMKSFGAQSPKIRALLSAVTMTPAFVSSGR